MNKASERWFGDVERRFFANVPDRPPEILQGNDCCSAPEPPDQLRERMDRQARAALQPPSPTTFSQPLAEWLGRWHQCPQFPPTVLENSQAVHAEVERHCQTLRDLGETPEDASRALDNIEDWLQRLLLAGEPQTTDHREDKAGFNGRATLPPGRRRVALLQLLLWLEIALEGPK
jgi:hypothetical protein